MVGHAAVLDITRNSHVFTVTVTTNPVENHGNPAAEVRHYYPQSRVAIKYPVPHETHCRRDQFVFPAYRAVQVVGAVDLRRIHRRLKGWMNQQENPEPLKFCVE